MRRDTVDKAHLYPRHARQGEEVQERAVQQLVMAGVAARQDLPPGIEELAGGGWAWWVGGVFCVFCVCACVSIVRVGGGRLLDNMVSKHLRCQQVRTRTYIYIQLEFGFWLRLRLRLKLRLGLKQHRQAPQCHHRRPPTDTMERRRIRPHPQARRCTCNAIHRDRPVRRVLPNTADNVRQQLIPLCHLGLSANAAMMHPCDDCLLFVPFAAGAAAAAAAAAIVNIDAVAAFIP